MIEANENIGLVTLRRQNDLETSQREAAAVLARVAQTAPVADASAVPVPPAPSAAEAAGTVLQAPQQSAPAEGGMPAAGRARLGITAGLVVLLVVAWIWQRRASSRR